MPKTTSSSPSSSPAKKSSAQQPAKLKTKAPVRVKAQVAKKPTVKQTAPVNQKPATRSISGNQYIIWTIIIITAVLAYTMIWISFWYKSGLEGEVSVLIPDRNVNANANTNASAIPSIVRAEISKWDIGSVTGPVTTNQQLLTQEYFESLPGELILPICESAGYNPMNYLGRSITLASYNTNLEYRDAVNDAVPVMLYAMYTETDPVCLYEYARDLTPGLFAVNDTDFIKQKSTVNANTNANTNTGSITNTATWSSYENTQYQYSVRYPSDWADENTSVSNPAMFADPVAVAQTIVTDLLQGTKVEIYVENSSASTVAEAVSTKDIEWTVNYETQTTVDNVPAVRRQVQALSFSNVTYILKNNKLYSIIQYIPVQTDRGKYTAIYDQILSNFSFTQ